MLDYFLYSSTPYYGGCPSTLALLLFAHFFFLISSLISFISFNSSELLLSCSSTLSFPLVSALLYVGATSSVVGESTSCFEWASKTPISSTLSLFFSCSVVGTGSLGTSIAFAIFLFIFFPFSLISPSSPFIGPLVIPIRVRGEDFEQLSYSTSLNVTLPSMHSKVIKAVWGMFPENLSLT